MNESQRAFCMDILNLTGESIESDSHLGRPSTSRTSKDGECIQAAAVEEKKSILNN